MAKISKCVYIKIIESNRGKSGGDNEKPSTEFIEDSEELSWRSIAIFKHWTKVGDLVISSTYIYCLTCVWHTLVVNKNIQSACSHRKYILLGETINK